MSPPARLLRRKPGPAAVDPAILESLNPPQREAVTAGKHPVLVLAGAGSGKTRVLVHRIAWLVGSGMATPGELLAVTFTNKAAREMRERAQKLLGRPTTALWIGTFHGLANRMLRLHADEARLPKDYQILDASDQLALIKRLCRDLKINTEVLKPKTLRNFIASAKEAGLRPEAVDITWVRDGQKKLDFYAEYERRCQRQGLVDFGELLLRCTELLEGRPRVLANYHQKFRWLLIDEFQDTNAIQYRWLKLLCGKKAIPFAVGDDDQSIYGWRGAEVENMRRFTRDYKGARTVRLERNYRSTANILEAANSVIANNAERFSKALWTEGNEGAPITVCVTGKSSDEARYAVERVLDRGELALSDFAILYRANAQSRLFEEALIQEGIPYRIHGGLQFFRRAEVKDALAYLRLIVHRDDDPSFERIANNPRRRISRGTLDAVRRHAAENNRTMWEAAEQGHHFLARAQAQALGRFLELIRLLDQGIEGKPLDEQVAHVVHNSGLMARLKNSTDPSDEPRVENLNELVSAAAMLGYNLGKDASDPLQAFLAHTALESGDERREDDDAVQLMTMHASKGLEFPVVFLTGMEEELFPHRNAMRMDKGLEEERRLCYVGITRAEKELHLTRAKWRVLNGRGVANAPSRFLEEIPAKLLDEIEVESSRDPGPGRRRALRPHASARAAGRVPA